MKKRNIGLILSYINTFLNMVCGLFLSSFLLRKLGDTQYGVYQTMASFANYLVLLEFGAGTVMAKNISASKARKETSLNIEKNISTIWTITSTLSVIIAIVSVLFYTLIDRIYSNSMSVEEILLGKRMFVFIVVFLLTSFHSQTLNGIALAFEDYTFSSKNNIIKLVLRTAMIAGFVLRFQSALVIVIVDAIVGLGIAVYSYIYCVKRYHIRINMKSFDRFVFRTSIPLCVAIFLQGIINQANSNVGKFIIGIRIGPEEVALYSVALYIYSILSNVATIPVSLYVPQITSCVVAGVKERALTDTLVQPGRLITLVSGSIVFGFIAAGRPFIEIVYGAEYLSAWTMAVIIMLPTFVYSSTATVLNVLDAKNKRMGCSIILLFTALLNIVITLALIDRLGVMGIAIAMAISTLVGQIVALGIYYYKTVKVNTIYLLGKAFKGIVPYQIIGALVGCIISTFISNKYFAFVLSGCIYVLIAFGGFLLIGKNEEEAVMFQKLARKLQRGKHP